MTWRDNYRTASFRGASFHVESAESSHGRRQAVHEHAQRDVPYTEDLGRKAREFSVTGYLIGKNYNLDRDALVAACEVAGPGQLVHPYRGELTVVCRGLTVSESSQDGGMCRVSITFLEAGQASFPRAVTDSVNAISGASNITRLASIAGFLLKYATRGFPSFVRDSAAARLVAFADFLLSVGIPYNGDTNISAKYAYDIYKLKDNAATVADDGDDVSTSVSGIIGQVRDVYGSKSFPVLSSLYTHFDDKYAGGIETPSRQQQGANYDAIGEMVRLLSVTEAAKAAVLTDYPSYQEAIATRETLLDSIDEEAEYTANDEAFVALTELRAEIVRGIPQPDQRLPQLVEYVPSSTLPALVVAHRLYGDASRADEIAARNSPPHPGFLTGGQALEVLSDG